ncbi:MAG: ribosome biogenesis GTP-binding protein YihA/YsxC [Pseudomonadota bacterium]
MSRDNRKGKDGGRDAPRINVSFAKSAAKLSQCPEPNGPEIAFAGRSNAGKSSVLNRLTGSRRTAKVSKQPGRTQLLNFFDVAGGGRFVDLPGYGYARAEKSAQAAWQRTVNDYLSHRDALTGVVLVMDIRHPLQPYDIELIEWAAPSELPLRILLNKADKLKRGAQGKVLQQVRNAVAGAPLTSVQTFSAQTGQGVPELVSTLSDWLSVEIVFDESGPFEAPVTGSDPEH